MVEKEARSQSMAKTKADLFPRLIKGTSAFCMMNATAIEINLKGLYQSYSSEYDIMWPKRWGGDGGKVATYVEVPG
jgi:hypothetical protein